MNIEQTVAYNYLESQEPEYKNEIDPFMDFYLGVPPANVKKAQFIYENMEVIAFDQNHGKTTTTGYRFGDVAYSTDVKSFNRGTFEFLKDLKLWIIDCVGYSEHPTHSHLELTLEWIKRVRPEKAILTHMSHQLDYEELLRDLPQNVAPGFDGLIIDIS